MSHLVRKKDFYRFVLRHLDPRNWQREETLPVELESVLAARRPSPWS